MQAPRAGSRPALPGRSAGPTVAESGELYRLLVESVGDYAIFALDPTGHVLSWNTGARRIKGYDADEVLGRHFSIFYPAERIAEAFPEHELEVASRDGRFEDEGWRLRKDGSRFWANVVITALRGDDGQLTGFAKVTRDLTERRAAELALRESEQRFRLLVQGVRDYAIFMLDPTGHVMTWNDGAARIKGYSAAEIIGQHMSVFYPPEEVANGKADRELTIARTQGAFEEEGVRLRKDGTPFHANVLLTALRDESGQLIGYAKVTRDLTERLEAHERALEDARRLEREALARRAAEDRAHELNELAERLRRQTAELETQRAEAEMANKAKSTFLTAMSHELRTPLNAIGGYAELLALGISGPVSPLQIEQLDRIRRSQQHLLGVINDILNFSRIEAAQLRYEIGPVSMREVVDAVSPMISPQAERKGIAFRVEECDAGLTAHADKAKVQQILLNLLSNALKFTPSGGSMSLGCHRDGAEMVAVVRDSGIGIAASELEAIFEPFVQVGRTLTSDHEGTGLGLAISRDLARAMGGDIAVESTPGAGSTFTLRLPASDGRTPAR